MRQQEFVLGTPVGFPINEIIQMILDRGRLTKDDILLLWGLSEEQYEILKVELNGHKLIESGSKGVGGFVAYFAHKPKGAKEADVQEPTYRTEYERVAAGRLVELLNFQDLEEMLGNLVYSIRRARLRLTGEDRRGSKSELAAAVLTRYGIDLFSHKEVRALVAKRAKMTSPGRWHPGKGAALKFVEQLQFPIEYAGIPADEPPNDFEYLEGRVDLRPLQDFQIEVQKKLLAVLDKKSGRAIVTLPTGGGKTRVAVDTIRDWLTARYLHDSKGAGNVVLWLAHTDELCEQATLCFREVWQGSSNICPLMLFRFWGGYTRDMENHRDDLLTMHQRPAVLISTPQRLLNLLEGKIAAGEPILAALMQLVGMIVIDEAHRAAAPTYREIVKRFSKAEESPSIVGLTATPFRNEYVSDDPIAGTRELQELFRAIIDPIESLGDEPATELAEAWIFGTTDLRCNKDRDQTEGSGGDRLRESDRRGH